MVTGGKVCPFDGGPGLRLCRFVNPEQAAKAVTRVGAVEGQ